MAKRFAVIVLFCSLIVACCGTVRLPPQISNSMGWGPGTILTFDGDKDFTETERTAIAVACLNWASFTNGGIVCHVNFTRDFIERPFTGEVDDFVIIKTDSKDLSVLIAMTDGGDVDPDTILGYAPHSLNRLTGSRRAAIFLATDNMGEDGPMFDHYKVVNAVAKHEIGHILGFSHIDQYNERPNIMHAGLHSEDFVAGRAGGFGDDDFTQCLRLGLCR